LRRSDARSWSKVSKGTVILEEKANGSLEQLVKNRRLAIDQAKHTLDAAHAQQASAQKEVVALLERKHSWSATDLERYMTLIRSEHVNDQAVRQAKDAVLSAENALEEARSQLEKRERAQYHEEQIWSDTIRRNSTWVTFGLMGFNIFILLASLAIIEPWRRRRMVREIKSALEAQKSTADLAATNQSLAAIEAAIDATLDPDERPAVGPIAPDLKLEELEAAVPEVAESPVATVVEPTVESFPISTAEEATADTVKESLLSSQDTDSTAIDTANPTVQDAAEFVASIDIAGEVSTSMTEFEKLTAQAKDLISDRYISIRKKDLTTAVLTGAAAGCGLATLVLWALIKPH
jgi:sensitive to high expression protein 9, mitochondrial